MQEYGNLRCKQQFYIQKRQQEGNVLQRQFQHDCPSLSAAKRAERQARRDKFRKKRQEAYIAGEISDYSEEENIFSDSSKDEAGFVAIEVEGEAEMCLMAGEDTEVNSNLHISTLSPSTHTPQLLMQMSH